MPWFKKKQVCVHCGTRETRREFENQSACQECRRNILMSREEQRLCPVDGSMLVKLIKSEIIVDECPQCQGIWLDAGELEAIKQAANEEGMGAGMVLGMIT